jgi:hypothetical protein
VNKAAEALFPKKREDREEWSDYWRYKIKYSNNSVDSLIDELEIRKILKESIKRRSPKSSSLSQQPKR